MISRLKTCFIASLLLFQISGCAHMGDPCNNKPLARIPSPDGKLVVATYHRECASATYTVASIEKEKGFFASKEEPVCYLVTWSDRHPIDVVWKDANNILVSTSDRLQIYDVNDRKDSCGDIRVAYDVKFRNEQQISSDPRALADMKEIIKASGACIDAYYKAGYPTNDVVGDVNKMIEKGEQRSAAETLLGFISDARCPVSHETYARMMELSEKMDLKPGYLERVKPLVTP